MNRAFLALLLGALLLCSAGCKAPKADDKEAIRQGVVNYLMSLKGLNIPNMDIAVTQYYNLNDNGFGTILAFNSQKQPGTVPFGSPNASDPSNPAVRWGLWDPGVPTAFQPR